MGSNFHDLTFKELLADRKFIVSFCKNYLTDKLLLPVDWESLDLYRLSGEFVQNYSGSDKKGDPKKSSRIADVIYMFKYEGNKPGMLLFHCEHQSRPDKLLPLRLMNYISGALLDYAKVNGLTDGPADQLIELPLIIPVVYYHGEKSPYPYSVDVYDLFKDKAQAFEHLTNPILIDLSQYTDEQLLEHGHFSPIDIAYKYALSGKISDKTMSCFIKSLSGPAKSGALDSYWSVLQYCLRFWDYDSEKFFKRLNQEIPTLRGDIMTIEQQILNRGKREGIIEGKHEGHQEGDLDARREIAREMLGLNLSLEEICKTTRLDMTVVEEIAGE